MGMYNDYRSTNRETWKYCYTGRLLLEPAKKKFLELYRLEMAARNKVADLLKNPGVSPADARLAEGKREIERYGNEREQCTVFIHEFARNPDREFLLALGDVTYFDLAQGSVVEPVAASVDELTV